MAGESYYFLISLTLAVLAILHITNMIYLRVKSETILGEKYAPSQLGYDKFRKLSSIKGVAIACIVAVLLVANLVYGVFRILRLDDPDYARFMFIYVPIGVVLFIIVMLAVMRNKLKTDNR
jgi:hypothetical protein